MMAWRPWLFPALLLALTGAVLLLGGRSSRDPGRPLADDTGPAGAAALARYLESRGHQVQVLEEGLPEGSGTWVLAAPTARTVEKAEVERLERFVREGGVLVVLMPDLEAQRHLSAWLELEEGPLLSPAPGEGLLPSVDVPLALGPRGAPSVGTLVFAPGPTVAMGRLGAHALARQGEAVGLWRWQLGQGAVWVARGTDLLENRRLELGSHLAFWEGLASGGPLTFVETFHAQAGPLPQSRALTLTALQLVLCLLCAAWVLGPRLGPPRPTPRVHHRSSLESVRAFGWLLRRSRVEPDLLRAQRMRVRELGLERLGVPLQATDAAFARAVEARCARPAAWVTGVLDGLQAASRASNVRLGDYLRLAREAARLELAVLGQEGTTARTAAGTSLRSGEQHAA